jgi:serine/threonine protein kinase
MRLKHPQIIELYSFCLTDENEFALIMEYIPGGTLKEYIKKNKKLDEEEAKIILKQILEIILYCHKMNIIHHDLKPDNILFTDDIHKQIKIIDFGISSLMYDQSDAGSLLYLPPEIITHKDVTSSPSVDVWSIGCIFGEMLKGECLFKGENITKIKHLISLGDYELPKNISNLASDLLKKMLKLAGDGIIGFSKKPLKLIYKMAFFSLFLFVAVIIATIVIHVNNWQNIIFPGWTTIMLAITFLSALILFALGFIGEYIMRIYDETRQRPQYIVKETINIDKK